MGIAARKTRTASLHDPAYAEFVSMLATIRDQSGVKQKQVAQALGWNQSAVSKIENGQRRIDIVEFIRVANAIGIDPVPLVRKLQRMMAAEG
jgi:transcriptional regulator with XRE-family HTH domain